MGQLSDPFSNAEDDRAEFTLSGLPGEPHEPDGPDGDAGAEGDAGAGDATSPELPPGAEDARPPLVYELADWSDDERADITDRLGEAKIAHWWVEADLHVGQDDEAAVEALLDQVEGVEPLDDDRDQVAYDMVEWEDDRVVALVAALRSAELPFAFDDDELYVYADDEQAVDDLIDAVAHPHELAEESDDGEVGAELLGELFVAADRLQHDARHHEGAVTLLDLERQLAAADPPYGLGARDWRRLQELTDVLAGQLRAATVDEDAVMASAAELRTALRDYV